MALGLFFALWTGPAGEGEGLKGRLLLELKGEGRMKGVWVLGDWQQCCMEADDCYQSEDPTAALQ